MRRKYITVSISSMGLMNFTIFHYSVSVRGTLIILLSVILLGTVFIVFDILPPSSIIFHNNNIARRIGLGNIPGKCTKRTKIVFLKTHKVRKGYLVCDLIYIISCYLLQPGYLHCQAQPKPKPANPQLGADTFSHRRSARIKKLI